MIQTNKVVKLEYELYIDGDEAGKEELMERMTAEAPLVYCHGIGMMLQKFEDNLEGKDAGDAFDFVVAKEDAYGEYDERGVLELDKKLFCIDGVFDNERVQVGAIVPMNTTDGQIVKAQVVEITDDKVTIDLNHPFAGEDLHFIGKILEVRDVTEGELKALRHEGGCGGCGGCGGGNCGEGDCGSCGGCQ